MSETKKSFKGWIRDGVELAGIKPERQNELLNQAKVLGGNLKNSAVRELEIMEKGIHTLEKKATEKLRKFRDS